MIRRVFGTFAKGRLLVFSRNLVGKMEMTVLGDVASHSVTPVIHAAALCLGQPSELVTAHVGDMARVDATQSSPINWESVKILVCNAAVQWNAAVVEPVLREAIDRRIPVLVENADLADASAAALIRQALGAFPKSGLFYYERDEAGNAQMSVVDGNPATLSREA